MIEKDELGIEKVKEKGSGQAQVPPEDTMPDGVKEAIIISDWKLDAGDLGVHVAGLA